MFHHSPRIITDGLVMCLDAANSKSFRGEPTTNLWNFSVNDRCWNSAGDICTLRTNTSNNSFTIIGTASVAGAGAFIYPYFTTTNVHHTLSCTVKNNDNVDLSIPLYIRDGNNGATLANSANTVSGGETKHLTLTTTTPVSLSLATAAIYPACNSIDAYINVEVTDIQFEAKDHETPFVVGTRGSTVATDGGIIDLTGNENHGILYDITVSDNAIVTEGLITSYISVPTINFALTDYTIFCASRYNGVTKGRMVNGLTNNWIIGHHSGYTEVYYSNGWVSSTTAGTSDNNWRIYAATGDILGDLYASYINGTQTYSNSNGSIGPNGICIGKYAPGATQASTGELSFIMAYNRILNQPEITQNYNALRGRFGL